MVCMIRDMGLVVYSAPCTLKVTCLRSLCVKYFFCKMRTGASLWEGQWAVKKKYEEYWRILQDYFQSGVLSKQSKEDFHPFMVAVQGHSTG